MTALARGTNNGDSFDEIFKDMRTSALIPIALGGLGILKGNRSGSGSGIFSWFKGAAEKTLLVKTATAISRIPIIERIKDEILSKTKELINSLIA